MDRAAERWPPVWSGETPRHHASTDRLGYWETPAVQGDSALHAARRARRRSRLCIGASTVLDGLCLDSGQVRLCPQCCPASRAHAPPRRVDRSGPPAAATSGRAAPATWADPALPGAPRSRRQSKTPVADGRRAYVGSPQHVGGGRGGSVPGALQSGKRHAAPRGGHGGCGRWCLACARDPRETHCSMGRRARPGPMPTALCPAVAGENAAGS